MTNKQLAEFLKGNPPTSKQVRQLSYAYFELADALILLLEKSEWYTKHCNIQHNTREILTSHGFVVEKKKDKRL